MNKTEVNQTGGFPLETDTLNALQSAYSIFNALGELAGNFAIISGCATTGSAVSDGVVYINGEVFNFKGATKSSYVIIKEDTETRNFEDGQNKVVYKTRYVTFGSASTKYAWTSFKRIKSVQTIDTEKESKSTVSALAQKVSIAEANINKKEDKTVVSALTNTVNNLVIKVMPVGGIIMWSGSTSNIPNGWVLCNGSNGTPDLRNRFVVGAGSSYNVGNTGGANTVKLEEEHMPEHSHTGTTDEGGEHTHSGKTDDDDGGGHYHWINANIDGRATTYSSEVHIQGENRYTKNDNSQASTEWGGKHEHKLKINNSEKHMHTFTTDTKGNSDPHENRPPYYALAYIMFKG